MFSGWVGKLNSNCNSMGLEFVSKSLYTCANVYTTRPLNRVCWILRVRVHPPNQKLSRFGLIKLIYLLMN